jgi:hypothetical protein
MKSPESGNRQIEIPRVVSFLEQPDGESAQLTPPSPLATEYCIELLHDLSSTFAAVLINAQVLDGKIPSYSRSKRYVHEIERSVQRGGALLQRLLDRLPAEGIGACDKDTESGDREFGLGKVPPVAERTAVVVNQGPNAAANSALDFAPSAAAHAAPDFVSRRVDAHRRV